MRRLALALVALLASCAAEVEQVPTSDGGGRFAAFATPDGVEVREREGGWAATFTAGCYAVTLAGPQRTFSEPTASDPVTHSTWVRTLPAPFDGKIDEGWLAAALAANAAEVPDVLALAMEYVAGAPAVLEEGLQISGDSSYGPLQPDGTRSEGSDFNDYLGMDWPYPAGLDPAEPAQLRCLDCSGFVRMIYGYRHHLPGAGYEDRIPLALEVEDGSALPRHSFEMYASAPGVVIAADVGAPQTDLARVRAGDLVFFDTDASDGAQLDHVGIYLGLDAAAHHRFISSRKLADGPTMGDSSARSVLDGDGTYATAFRAVRRL